MPSIANSILVRVKGKKKKMLDENWICLGVIDKLCERFLVVVVIHSYQLGRHQGVLLMQRGLELSPNKLREIQEIEKKTHDKII